MALASDILLLLAAFSAAFYCRVLANRLKRLESTDIGIGGAISTFTTQVDDMKLALEHVNLQSNRQAAVLGDLTKKAERAARRLELLLAALHENDDMDSNKSHGETTLQLSRSERVGKRAQGGVVQKKQNHSALATASPKISELTK